MPIKRKVIEYEERVVVEEIPREVVMTDYYAVENIKQYYKEVIPEKKIEMVPVEKKVKRVEYVPVEKFFLPSNADRLSTILKTRTRISPKVRVG